MKKSLIALAALVVGLCALAMPASASTFSPPDAQTLRVHKDPVLMPAVLTGAEATLEARKAAKKKSVKKADAAQAARVQVCFGCDGLLGGKAPAKKEPKKPGGGKKKMDAAHGPGVDGEGEEQTIRRLLT